ncbi:flippase [Candidatus Poribacteria bacterium]|nr:flippase [Candidatus Poribacteria bacterium]
MKSKDLALKGQMKNESTQSLSWLRLAAGNSLWLMTAQAMSKVVSFVTFIWLARYLSETDFGALNLAFSYWTIVLGFTEGGTGALVIREVARNRNLSMNYLTSVVVFKGLFSGILFLVTAALGPKLGVLAGQTKFSTVLVLGIGLTASQVVWYSFIVLFRGHQAFRFEALISVIGTATHALSMITGISLGLPLVGLAYLMTMGHVVLAVLTGLIYAIKIEPLRPHFQWDFTIRFLRASLPFAMAYIAGNLTFRIDAILLSAMVGDMALGIYAASTRLVEQGMFVTSAALITVYPLLSAAFPIHRNRISLVSEKSLKFIILVAMPMASLTAGSALQIITLLYGGKYLSTATIFPLLVLWFFVWSAKTVTVVVLQAVNSEKTVAFQSMCGLVVNIGLNVLLIPSYSFVGAAVSNLASELLMLGIGVYKIDILGYRMNILRNTCMPLIAYGSVLGLIALVAHLISASWGWLPWWIVGFLFYIVLLKCAHYFDAWDRMAMSKVSQSLVCVNIRALIGGWLGKASRR